MPGLVPSFSAFSLMYVCAFPIAVRISRPALDASAILKRSYLALATSTSAIGERVSIQPSYRFDTIAVDEGLKKYERAVQLNIWYVCADAVSVIKAKTSKASY